MTIEEFNRRKVPIDDRLDQFVNLPVFQPKVDKANEILKKVGLPTSKSKTG